MTSSLQEQIKSINPHATNNRDWSGRRDPDRATVFILKESDFKVIINITDWGFYDNNTDNIFSLDKDKNEWITFVDEYHTHNNYNSLYYHNQVATYLHGKGAKHGDLVLSPSKWWDNVDDISNVYRIYTVKKGVPTIELIGSDIARYLNEDGWAENEPIIGFSSPDIKYSLGPNYPVGYWGGAPETQDLCGGGGDGDFLRLEPVAAKHLYTNLENPVDVTVDDLTYEDGQSTLNLEWGGLQFPGEPKDVVRQLILYHKYENYLRYRPDTARTSTDTITQIRIRSGLEKQQIRTRDGNYVMSHQPETLWNYGLNNSYHINGRILFTYRGKTKLGQPIGRVLRLRDIYSEYHNTYRLSVWDEVVIIDNMMEALKDQLVRLDSRWTIDELEYLPSPWGDMNEFDNDDFEDVINDQTYQENIVQKGLEYIKNFNHFILQKLHQHFVHPTPTRMIRSDIIKTARAAIKNETLDISSIKGLSHMTIELINTCLNNLNKERKNKINTMTKIHDILLQ